MCAALALALPTTPTNQRFMEEEDSCDFVTRLASTMGWVDHAHLLAADYLHQQWQPERVRGSEKALPGRPSSGTGGWGCLGEKEGRQGRHPCSNPYGVVGQDAACGRETGGRSASIQRSVLVPAWSVLAG